MDTHPANRPVVSLSSAVIALLAAWLVVCPWVIGAPGPRVANIGIICGVRNGGDGHTWNYTIVGVVIAGLETLSLTASAMRPHTSRSKIVLVVT